LVLLERAGREQHAPIWRSASKLLGRSAAGKVEVNVGRISKVAGEGEAVFVPGKVLGFGRVEKRVVVGAFSFSASAKSKIIAGGGSALTVEEFVNAYPRGSGVKLVQ
jgi:large subunit ribosomal protein L18e